MDGRVKSLEGNRYAQVFANKGYFSKIYPMNSKGEAGDALRTFCREFGVPEHLTFDGSKEQTGKNTEFMSQIRKNDINYKISEKGYHKIQLKVVLENCAGNGTGLWLGREFQLDFGIME